MPSVIFGNDSSFIKLSAQHLQGGNLVAFPTETVYGLGADATSDQAVAKVFALKGRPSFNPLIVHLENVAIAQQLVQWNAVAETLAKAFWPGPLTLILPRQQDCPVSLLASAGLDSLAVRIPAHPLAQALLKETGKPIAAPSANRSGRVSPTLAIHVATEFEGQDENNELRIIDGGACVIGLESTVVDLTGKTPILLRPGAVTREQLEALIGPLAQPKIGDVITSPGLLASHYAPSLPVRLNAERAEFGEAFIAFGQNHTECSCDFNLSNAGNLMEAAAHLFAALRRFDQPDRYHGIAIATIPEEGLGVAINDRLRRAATR